eukprot:jgi/Bigna1/51495/estExt_Genewise1Plus.C_10223
MADEAVCIGPAASADSYLRTDRILEAIEQTGAEAVHPGYGFLSENSEFSNMLAERNIKFIGPGAFAINAMGCDKIHSKKIASDAKVNTIPGYVGEINNEEELLKVANEIGYPVMIKASAGGGGKGMRIAWSDEEAKQGYRLSKREAAASFGDDTIFVEKFVEDPRHIEIQVLMDSFGNGVYLNERECSIQRRNQKVIEEAPSVAVDPETRKAMGKQALQLAAAVEYQSAGTVEFLMDKHKNFYFLEMNTRLQVEHPITELISQVDLVEQMIRVAAGLPLEMKQNDIGIHGWAIESRVYAEDPYREFLPSTGLLTRYKEPGGADVRVDSGVAEGSEISMFYDPMISKLVTHGPNREAALESMRGALDSYEISGLRHNLPFLRALCDHEAFISGNITTKFIPDHYPDGFKGSSTTTQQHQQQQEHIEELMQHFNAISEDMIHIQVLDTPKNRAESKQQDADTPSYRELSVEVGDALPPMSVRSQYAEGDRTCTSMLAGGAGGEMGSDDGTFVQIQRSETPNYQLVYKAEEFKIQVVSPRVYELMTHMPVIAPVDLSKMVLSPMPGLVYSVNIKEGQEVSLGQEVAVVEAMKMQNALQSPASGIIKKVLVEAGQSVDADQILIELE